MRIRVLISAALTAAFLAAAPAASATESFVPWNWCGFHATTDALRLRAAPSTGAVLGLLDPGDRMVSDGQHGAWTRVTLSGRSGRGIPARTTGWVAARYLEPEACTTFG